MEELKIVYLPPDDLIPYENNAKLHPADQVEKIANSLRRFGFRKPVVIDENNVLVAGHGAVLAAQVLGLDAVPCVRTGDLSDAEVAAYRLADNETNKGGYDFAMLEAELEQLSKSDLDFDMSEFGFEDIQGGGI